MDINALKSTSSPAASTQAAGGKNAEMGKDQFLKLFVAQLQHQDPMNPMQDQDFMGQMASFSTLEQVTNMAKANEAMASNLALSQSVGLIGRTVTWTTDAAGTTQTGRVEKVNHTEDGKTVLTVGGTEGVDPSKITQIA
ncbi:MAG TPA: flagellar hook capping FlgD N-terminal domain-containing protein [Solirubrobacteraceae bacterium]|nr:flagellar hook capping FlgD N-terminal domain-containing protein [Solirubrobacteraceae bacterium]